MWPFVHRPGDPTAVLSSELPDALPDALGRALAQATDGHSLRILIASGMTELAQCSAAVVRLTPDASRDVGRVDLTVASLRADEPEMELPPRSRLVKWLRVNGEVFITRTRPDVVAYLSQGERAELAAHSVRACVPLLSDSGLVGFAGLVQEDPQWGPDSRHLTPLLSLGRHAAIAVEQMAVREAERVRAEARHRAHQLAVAGQLAAAVVHEVRNPLGAIRSTVQYTMSSGADWVQKHALLGRVLDEIDRVNQTLSGALSLSRPTELIYEDVDLVALAEHCVALVHAYSEGQGLQLTLRLDIRPLVVRGDARELRQVILNVLLNACQATPSGGIVTITSEVQATAGEPEGARPSQAAVRVTDTGKGIPSADLPRLFDPFFTTKKTGTGLGLPICLEIMNRHGGSMRIESELGQGTTVVLTLPLWRSDGAHLDC